MRTNTQSDKVKKAGKRRTEIVFADYHSLKPQTKAVCLLRITITVDCYSSTPEIHISLHKPLKA